MGIWSSKSKKKEGEQEKLINRNNKVNQGKPKKPKYGIFTEVPNFYFLFSAKLKNMHGNENLMVRYQIVNKDLDKDNLALVFIDRIIKDDKITNKIQSLGEVQTKLINISSREISKNTKSEIKKAILIIKENLKIYEKQFEEKINESEQKKNANAVANAPANAVANAPANSGAKNNTGAKINAGGGSRRKKSKKSRS